MCVGTPFRLISISCIAPYLAMSCIPTTAHADSFVVVVRFASVMCSSICFFMDRITKLRCEIRRVLRLFLDNLTRQAIHLYSCLSLWPPGSSLVPIFGYAYAILELRSCHISYPLVTPKQTILPPLPAYYPLLDVCCLASRRHA